MVLLPRALSQLSARPEGERLVPHYLGPRDERWLRALLDEYARFAGGAVDELRERLREPLPVPAPKTKLRMAIHVLERLVQIKPAASVPAREARWVVFSKAASSRAPRDLVLADAAAALNVTDEEVEASLFADLQSQRRVAELPQDLSPSALSIMINQAILASLLRRAIRVRLTVWGNTRALVRHARLLGLICVVSRARERSPATGSHSVRLGAVEASPTRDGLEPAGVQLDISGPFALFRQTAVYGRALASLLPRAAWCHYFELEASCVTSSAAPPAILLVRTGDPVCPGRELQRFDSSIEERFFKQFRKAARGWDVIREPAPIEAEGTLIFPDFELVNRRDPARRWLLEIVGFWTPEYLNEKLRRLRAAGIERLVLCIDERRSCGAESLPRDARIVRYRTRIDPAAVLALVQAQAQQ